MTFDSIRFIAMIFCSLRHMITRFVQVDNLLFWQLNLGGQKLYLCKNTLKVTDDGLKVITYYKYYNRNTSCIKIFEEVN